MMKCLTGGVMKVSQVMTPDPACCLPQDTVDIAARLMRIQDVGMIPVVDDERSPRLLGVVTDRDLALLVVAQGLEPRKTTVEEVMTRNVITCEESDNLQEVLDSMKSHQVRRIPVVANDNGVVGVVSQSDIALRLKDPETTGEVVADISKPSFPQSWRAFKNELRSRWNRLTEDDLEGVFGDRESLILRLQERYAMQRMDAEREVDQFWEKLTTTVKQ
jgi:CBS domain-containing protein